jgi:hypothetical protein
MYNVTLYRTPGFICQIGMITKCEECDQVLAGDEVEYLYKGKSYCDDCYEVVKAIETS